MNIFLICLYVFLGLLAFFLLFVFGPTFTMFNMAFRPCKSITLKDVKDPKKTIYGPYLDELFSTYDKLMARNPRRLTLKARDGALLKGDYFENGSNKIAILFPGFHGNLSNNFIMQTQFLLELGYDVLAVTERGHDDSGGKWLGIGVIEKFDCVDWVNYARDELKKSDCLIWGVSMGGAIVAYASDLVDPEFVKAMIIDCAFVSPRKHVIKDCKMRFIPPFLIVPFLEFYVNKIIGISFREETVEHLSKTTIPAFFIHGKDDRSVPIACGYANYEACASPKEYYWVDNCRHIISFIVGGNEIRNKITNFINNYIK